MKTTFIRGAVTLLAVCTILFTAVAQPLTAQDEKKPQESSRLEKPVSYTHLTLPTSDLV